MLAAVAYQMRAIGENLVPIGSARLSPDGMFAGQRHAADEFAVRDVAIALRIEYDAFGVGGKPGHFNRLDRAGCNSECGNQEKWEAHNTKVSQGRPEASPCLRRMRYRKRLGGRECVSAGFPGPRSRSQSDSRPCWL